MTRIASAEQLVHLQQASAERQASRACVAICGGTGCRAKGAERVAAAFAEALAQLGRGGVAMTSTGCHGFCERGPVVVLRPQGVFYQGVRVEDVPEIVSETLLAGRPVERLLYVDPVSGQRVTHEHEVPFYRRQQRVVLDLNGLIDPTDVTDYVAHGGYAALARALRGLTPEEVIAQVTSARLRGRGGAGFPTGLKWRLCRGAPGEPKYVVCNADEGDPGAYMDRSLMEGNPHRVLEGMIIGAYAIGASRGFVYIRNEYPLAVKHLHTAIEQATAHGLLGEDILGSGFSFRVEVRLGGGAFVCGEETALMASIEGRTGEPRPRPPFPAQSGLWGQPTNINNVETWANVPLIIARGADWFASLGSEASGGTKIFSLVGKVNNTGLVEVPIGTPLGDII
ncbi:MAG: NAD(P)H-dependent oxidoreductase subunit E, partial [Anaerolineae bacterium]|nr:NAD(P)H-dependent oxidoreductase subunit E [Anaerolineae bacterium]